MIELFVFFASLIFRKDLQKEKNFGKLNTSC